MTDLKTALQHLSARGITTLEQLAESKVHMRRPGRIESEKALKDILERSAGRTQPSARSKPAPPSASIPIVLDGKRVEYNEIARLNGQPLDYVATTLGDGQQALVAFSDRSALRDRLLRLFNGFDSEVEHAVASGGLQPKRTPVTRVDLGLQIFEHIDYGGSSWTFAPEEYVDDLRTFDAGLGWFEGDWNDKISSVQMGRCYCIAWEHIHEGGDSLTLYQDTPNLHTIGWGDRISTIWAPFRN